jgi:hypothetical protein
MLETALTPEKPWLIGINPIVAKAAKIDAAG